MLRPRLQPSSTYGVKWLIGIHREHHGHTWAVAPSLPCQLPSTTTSMVALYDVLFYGKFFAKY
jgi:hypothetical protein